MDNHRLQALHDAGQSIWLDYIDRTMLHNGDLERRLSDDVLTGMTSNPTIFQKALAEGTAYDDQLRAAPTSLDLKQLFELVETQDVRDACDIFADVYHSTKGADGFVSIEVSPGVADDVDATVEEAHRLWKTVNRPNLLVKVPGTEEGAKAVRRLITDGINVNITLLFAVKAHERVIDAYIDGLEARVAKALPIDSIASVASFFVSRVDTEVDKRENSRAKLLLQTRRWHISSFCQSSRAHAGQRSRRRVHAFSARSGPVRAPRMRPIATCSTSKRSSGQTR